MKISSIVKDGRINLLYGVDFQAAINGCLNEIIPLRMVYYANSNLEKRIPSLGQLFEKHGVKKDDIVHFESLNKNGVTTFKISF